MIWYPTPQHWLRQESLIKSCAWLAVMGWRGRISEPLELIIQCEKRSCLWKWFTWGSWRCVVCEEYWPRWEFGLLLRDWCLSWWFDLILLQLLGSEYYYCYCGDTSLLGCLGCRKEETHRTWGWGWGLKPQEVLISQVRRLVQNQGKIGSFGVCEDRMCSRPFSLVCR